MKDRILQIVKEEEMTNSRFAQEIGVQPSSISHIVSGRNKASIELVTKILHRFPGINPEWLLMGKEPMYKTGRVTERVESTGDLFSQPSGTPGRQQDTIHKDTKDNPEKSGESNAFHRDEAPLDNAPNGKTGKKVEKIVVFYADNTFSEYNPA